MTKKIRNVFNESDVKEIIAQNRQSPGYSVAEMRKDYNHPNGAKFKAGDEIIFKGKRFIITSVAEEDDGEFEYTMKYSDLFHGVELAYPWCVWESELFHSIDE